MIESRRESRGLAVVSAVRAVQASVPSRGMVTRSIMALNKSALSLKCQ